MYVLIHEMNVTITFFKKLLRIIKICVDLPNVQPLSNLKHILQMRSSFCPINYTIKDSPNFNFFPLFIVVPLLFYLI